MGNPILLTITRRTGIALLVALAVAILTPAEDAAAQSPDWAFPSHVLLEGELRNVYMHGGAKPHVGGCHGLNHPSWYRYTCNQTGQGVWLAAKNFDDGDETWNHKVAHVGYRNTGAGEFFPTNLQRTVGNKTRPEVFVDGLDSFLDPLRYDEINADMEEAGRVVTEATAVNGLTMTRTVRAFSNEYHDDYHIVEYVITNTGDTDGDGERDVPEQTLEDVYFYQTRNYEVNQMGGNIAGNGGGWGRNVMHEVSDGDGLKQHNEDMRAQFAWLGNEPQFTRWNSIGAPAITDEFSLIFEGDSLGRLTAAHMVGMATLHADARAHAPGETAPDDSTQPSLTGFMSNGSPLNSNSHQNREKMAREYDLLEEGTVEIGGPGSHADFIVGPPESTPEPKEEWRRRMANQTEDPGVDIEGINNYTVYGPYDLEAGEQFRIVQVEGVQGLSRQASYEIGAAYKDLWQAGTPDEPIGYDADGDGTIDADERMSKNMWVMTTRDSLFEMFRKAEANFEAGYEIPDPPMPPESFSVRGLPNRVAIEWSMYDGASPAHGFELYRGSIRREGDPDNVDYELVAGPDELGPSTRSYEDTGVQRGIPYFYYIQAVGEETDQAGPAGTPAGVRLRSNRVYTQTWNPVTLVRGPGEEITDARVVPNPYTLTSDQDVRWPGQQDQIQFLDIPGECTIRIYTESGQLVETIEHTDGSGDESWDLTTESNQLVVSGIYGAVITTPDGRQTVRKFTIIR